MVVVDTALFFAKQEIAKERKGGFEILFRLDKTFLFVSYLSPQNPKP